MKLDKIVENEEPCKDAYDLLKEFKFNEEVKYYKCCKPECEFSLYNGIEHVCKKYSSESIIESIKLRIGQ
jgi:hypothetical protein